MKVKFGCSFDYVGCVREEIIEIRDDATEEEIEMLADEYAHEHFDWWWEKCD